MPHARWSSGGGVERLRARIIGPENLVEVVLSRSSLVRLLLFLLAAWGVLFTAMLSHFVLTTEENPDGRAIIRMAVALVLIWCVLGGSLMYLLRDRFVAWARRIPLGWRTRFALLCTGFALLEEAGTTTLTNLAPLFGGVTDAARITASANYLEVVLLNSVVVFVPMFVAWAWLLSRNDYRPAEVLLLFGLAGTLGEPERRPGRTPDPGSRGGSCPLPRRPSGGGYDPSWRFSVNLHAIRPEPGSPGSRCASAPTPNLPGRSTSRRLVASDLALRRSA